MRIWLSNAALFCLSVDSLLLSSENRLFLMEFSLSNIEFMSKSLDRFLVALAADLANLSEADSSSSFIGGGP